jgi:hypothetical protein
MKRKILITTIFIVILGILLTSFIVVGKTIRNNEQVSNENGQYVVNGKLWGEPEVLKSFITPKQTAIELQATYLKKDNDMMTVRATYDWLESGYHYETDSLEVRNGGHTIFKGNCDTWNMPVFTLAVKHYNNGGLWVDCEDGTFLLVSLLRANGINAWANIGTVDINGSIYGHAWATVDFNGQEFLLETTLGQPLQELKPVPSFYSPSFTFDEKDVHPRKFGAIVDELLTPLPPAKIKDLQSLLDGKTN